MRILPVIIIIAMMCSCGSGNNPAVKESVAKIVFMLGDVSVEKNGSKIKASLNNIIDRGSVIKTSKASQCNVLIEPDSYVLVKENSSFSISSLLQEGGGVTKSSVDLHSGTLAVNPGKLLKGSEFKVKTPTAVAAVRGTKFTVSSEEGKGVQISVLEGKVELKPRIELLEKSDTPEAVKTECSAKIDGRAVVVGERQSAEIRSESSEKISREIAAVIEDYKKAEILPDDKKADVRNAAISKITAVVEQGVPVTADSISIESVKDLESLSKSVEDVKMKKQGENKTTGTINILNPVNDADVLVDGRRVGRGSVSLKLASGVKTKIEIRARKFEPYVYEATLGIGEEKTLQPELVRTKLLDRIEWNDRIGNVKGDIALAGGLVVSAASSGTVSATRGNGIRVWSASVGSPISSTPAVNGSAVYVVGTNQILYSIDIKSGKILWKAKTGGDLTFGSSPCVEGNIVVTALSNGVVKGFSKDGKELWSENLKAGIYSSPASSGGNIYIGADDQILYSMSASDGSVNWKGKLDGRVVSSSPVIADDAVIIGTYKGALTALSIRNGKQLWSFKAKGAIVSTPVVNGGTVYFGSRDRTVYALKRSTGELVWSFQTASPVTADISVSGDVMYVLSGNTVYSFGVQDRKLNWTFEYPSAVTSVQSEGGRVYLGGNAGVTGLRTDLRDVIRQ
jgi:outer membrane protein assembly factor BamB